VSERGKLWEELVEEEHGEGVGREELIGEEVGREELIGEELVGEDLIGEELGWGGVRTLACLRLVLVITRNLC
jgi:hypothetical protein